MHRLLALFIFIPLLYGCVGNPIKDRDNDTVSLVVALVNMDAVNARCNTGQLKNIDNESDSKTLWYMYRANHENQCILYSKAVEPGRYTIESFATFAMTGASSSTATNFMLPNKGIPYGIHKIKKQDVYFLGSYKFVRTKTGAISVVKSKDPGEKQVLSEMLQHRLMQDGEWKEIVKHKLKRLR